MLTAVAKRELPKLGILYCSLLILLAAGAMVVGGCAGVVSGKSSTSTTAPPPTASTLVISNVQAASATSSGFQVNWVTNVAADSAIDYGTSSSYGSTTPVTPAMVTTHQMSLTGLAAGTLYHFRVKSTDASKNVATSGDMTSSTVANSAPAPSIAGLSPAGGAVGTSVVISGASFGSTQGASTVKFSGTVATPTSWSATSIKTSVPAGAATGNVVVTVSGVASNGANFTVTTTVDTVPPSVPTGLVATGISSSQIGLAWTASTDNVGVAGYRIYRGGAQVGTSTGSAYQDSGLNAATQYTYTVAAYDAAGNVSAQSAGASATTQAASGGGSGLPTSIGWYQIPNTNYSAVCPNPLPAGAEGCSAVVADWSSGVADTKRNRLVFMGGGHSGYDGNEIYALDLNLLQMLRVTNPGPATDCTEADSAGNPSARHTYGGLSYISSTDQVYLHAGDLYASNTGGCTSVANWLLNEASIAGNANNTPQWQRKDPVNGTPVTKDCCNYITASAYDANTDAVYYVDDAFFWKYQAQTDTLTTLGAVSGLGYHLNAVVDAGHKVYVAFGDGELWQADLTAATPAVSNIASQASGCSALTSAPYPGLAYDPVQNKVVGWIGGGSVIVYDAATKSCTTQSYTGGPGAALATGTFGRWQYFPSLGVFALVNDWQQNAWVLRMTAGGSGGGGSGAPVISAIAANAITTSAATIAWTTDVAGTSQVEYGTTSTYGTLTALNSTLLTAHAVGLTGLSSNTLYHYRVHSKNGSGVEAISGDMAFATNSSGDTIPPTVTLTAPGAGATVSGPVTISANATDNVGVVGVQFMVDSANVGAEVMSSPYGVSWDTTGAANGAHTVTARARDAAGNTAVSTAVTVNVSNTGSAGTTTFAQRCAAAGVIKCVGFDTASEITPFVSADANGVIQASLDTTVSASGGGSLKFVIPANSGQNSSGAWADTLGGSFGPGTTFFVQFRQRFSPEFISTQYNGEGWKQSIFHMAGKTCASVELTTVNPFQRGFPEMYTNCGGVPFEVNLGNGDYLLEQGDTSSSGYNCHYQNQNPAGCAYYQPNQWMTFSYEVKIGNWNQPDSSIKAWVAYEGGPLKEFVNIQNQVLQYNTSPSDVYNWITLLPYNTTKPAGQTNPVAYTWYDELIVSTQPIPAPTGPTPAP